MDDKYIVRVTKKNGDHKDFSSPTQAQAVELAMDWMRAQHLEDALNEAKTTNHFMLIRLTPKTEAAH